MPPVRRVTPVENHCPRGSCLWERGRRSSSVCPEHPAKDRGPWGVQRTVTWLARPLSLSVGPVKSLWLLCQHQSPLCPDGRGRSPQGHSPWILAASCLSLSSSEFLLGHLRTPSSIYNNPALKPSLSLTIYPPFPSPHPHLISPLSGHWIAPAPRHKLPP